ncbi:3-dehydroquinate synthase [Mucilaginibacter limnophilus]|uniref:3-dehydroquinate synthase n=1 Tax=Mucilaginibacter limnophilus TaxID=1932778 RepID=A0A3S2UR43_9SPHI|nr:3-dehydroquinate synthase [Mucilaginibacter limnophilus]RVU02575.1 3-dehydroquinate synthase [Mucilaginibacter limnophilus]
MDTIYSDGYHIYFNNVVDELIRFIKNGGYSRFFVLTDENTSEHCLPVIKEQLDELGNYDVIEINAGEESKNIDFCIGIWRMLVDFEADRKALMVNLGGGVVTDMGGFAASTYKRGIDFVQVPTTLLSQVDASVGGKTGIDVEGIKNIIGTFTQPKAVFIDVAFLQTLPERQILSGLAEMLKHGLILDAEYWQKLKDSDLKQPSAELIHHSVVLKNKVVLEDPKEKNIRKSLNFGHTIGHAVETWSLTHDSNPLTHGEAIALGMICEGYLAHKKSGLKAEELEEIVSVIDSLYPRYSFKHSIYEELYSIMLKDKKNFDGKVNCTLLSVIGQFSIDNVCTKEELFEALDYYVNR